jgi:hypothetical protein
MTLLSPKKKNLKLGFSITGESRRGFGEASTTRLWAAGCRRMVGGLAKGTPHLE